MNIGMIVCLILGIMFSLFALIFTVLKEKAAMLISGFNTMDKKKRELYDTKKMSADQRNQFLIGALIMFTGTMFSMISQYFSIVAFVIWLVVFFKEVHLDEDKAFGKYKIH